jgi:hypothetical protein
MMKRESREGQGEPSLDFFCEINAICTLFKKKIISDSCKQNDELKVRRMNVAKEDVNSILRFSLSLFGGFRWRKKKISFAGRARAGVPLRNVRIPLSYRSSINSIN